MPLNLTVIVGALLFVAGVSVLLGMFIGGIVGRVRERRASRDEAAERCTTTLEQPAVKIPDLPVRVHTRTWDETVTICLPEHLRDRVNRR